MAILITGASAGFGETMCRRFVQEGFAVIGAARRLDKLTQLSNELGELFYPLEMDITDKTSVNTALASLPENFRQIDGLINNAGLALGLEPAQTADFNDWETMIYTNIIGLAYLTHQILPQMVERKDGYIINIGSIAGNYAYPGSNIYGASKAFVRQFSLNLRADVHGTGVRVSNVEPGLCSGTEFSQVRFKGDNARAASVYEYTEALNADDIANTVLWLYQCPKHMNVNSIEIMPVSQSFGALPVYRTPPLTSNTNTIAEKHNQTHLEKKGLFEKLTSWIK